MRFVSDFPISRLMIPKVAEGKVLMCLGISGSGSLRSCRVLLPR